MPPMIPTDCSALCAPAILKHSKSALIGLLSHVLAGHKGAYSLLRASTTSLHAPFAPGISTILESVDKFMKRKVNFVLTKSYLQKKDFMFYMMLVILISVFIMNLLVSALYVGGQYLKKNAKESYGQYSLSDF